MNILIPDITFDTLMIMDPLEQVSSLYFELSNPDRIKILRCLNEAPEKLTTIAKTIEITHQQCLRHLKRLTDMQLVDKTHDGSYTITSYGGLVLSFIPALSFISLNRDYFNTHSLNQIPSEFLSRLGELSESITISNVMEALSEIESLVKNVEEYLNVIINKRTHSIRPYIAEAIRRGVKVNSISITSYVPTYDVKRVINIEDELEIIKAEKNGTVIVADQTEFPIYLYSSEKAVFISFPLHDGTFDYTGFLSSSPKAVKYCKDIFEYYWSRTNIISAAEIVNRHYKYLEYFGYH